MLEFVGLGRRPEPIQGEELSQLMAYYRFLDHRTVVMHLDGKRLVIRKKETNENITPFIPKGFVVDGGLYLERFRRKVFPLKPDESRDVGLLAEMDVEEAQERLNTPAGKVLFLVVSDEKAENGWNSGFISTDDILWGSPNQLITESEKLFDTGNDDIAKSKMLAALALTEENREEI